MKIQHISRNEQNTGKLIARKSKWRQAGFTLTELLVVLLIALILAALIMPAVQRGRESAKSAQCINNQRQILVGFAQYAGENNGKLPPTVNLLTGETWANLISPYLDEKYVGKNFMRCGSAKKTDVETYGVNYGESWPWRVFGLGPPGFNGMSDSKLLGQLPGNTILCADLSDKGGGPGAFLSPYAWQFDYDNNKDGIKDSFSGLLSRGPYNFVAFRHSGSTAIVGLANGSVRTITIADWQKNDGGMWGEPKW